LTSAQLNRESLLAQSAATLLPEPVGRGRDVKGTSLPVSSPGRLPRGSSFDFCGRFGSSQPFQSSFWEARCRFQTVSGGEAKGILVWIFLLGKHG